MWVIQGPTIAIGIWSGRQSCGTEPLIYRIWHSLQADSVRIELNCRHSAGITMNGLVWGNPPMFGDQECHMFFMNRKGETLLFFPPNISIDWKVAKMITTVLAMADMYWVWTCAKYIADNDHTPRGTVISISTFKMKTMRLGETVWCKRPKVTG